MSSQNGFFVADDYACVPEAKRAVDEFRSWHDISDAMYFVGKCTAYWRASSQLEQLRFDMYDKHVQAGRAPLGRTSFRFAVGAGAGGGVIDLNVEAGQSEEQAVAAYCASHTDLAEQLQGRFGVSCERLLLDDIRKVQSHGHL